MLELPLIHGMITMYFRREPAIIMALVVGLIQVLSAFVTHWTDEQQGTLNAAVALVGGLVTAGLVSLDKALPLLGGLVQAVFAVALAFGVEAAPEAQSVVLALVAAITGAFVRTQVTAKVPAVERDREA